MRSACCTLAVVALLGCGGGDDKTTAPKTLPGNYPLVTVSGNPLPAVYYQEPGYKEELTAGNIALNANGTFSNSYTVKFTEGTSSTTVTLACNGAWSQSGNNLAFTENATGDCGDVGSGSWDGNNSVTINWEFFGVPMVHRR